MNKKNLEKLHEEVKDYLKYSTDSYLKKAIVYELYYHYEDNIICDIQEIKYMINQGTQFLISEKKDVIFFSNLLSLQNAIKS